MVTNKSRCSYCGRVLHKQVSEKYFVCSLKCKSLIKNTEYIISVDSIVFDLNNYKWNKVCLLYTSPSPRDLSTSRMPSSA